MKKTTKAAMIMILAILMAGMIVLCIRFGKKTEEMPAGNAALRAASGEVQKQEENKNENNGTAGDQTEAGNQTSEEKAVSSMEGSRQIAEQLAAEAETARKTRSASRITLSDNGSTAAAYGVEIKDKAITIQASGIYSISGSLTEGQVTVDSDGTVVLILDNADITNTEEAAINIANADHTLIYLPEGSDSKISSGKETAVNNREDQRESQDALTAETSSGNPVGEAAEERAVVQKETTTELESDEEETTDSASGAALYAKDDLSIAGSGKLTVCGYINNAAATTDRLTVLGGQLDLTAVNNGLKGKDSVLIVDGQITINSGNDGIKSNNDEKDDCGNIDIQGGEIKISSSGDGITAEKNLLVEDGDITIKAGDPSKIYTSPTDFSQKEGNPGQPARDSKEGMASGESKNTGETDQQNGSFSEGEDDLQATGAPGSGDFSGDMGEFGPEGGDFPGDMGESGPGSGEEPPALPDGTGEGASRGGRSGFNPQNGSEPPALPDGMNEGDFPGGRGGFDSQNGSEPPALSDGMNEENSPEKGGSRGESGSREAKPDGSDRNDSSTDSDSSTKGLKSGMDICITGGKITISAVEDCVHADANVKISGGTLQLAAGDDALHADGEMSITEGTVTVTQSYEGIEGHQVNISGGEINVKASDDGINAGGNVGKDGSELPVVRISGGKIHVDASGDGIDSNGDLIIEGGLVIVDGPTNDGNGALDSGVENGGKLACNGGTVLAIGAAGMAESFGEESLQASFILNYPQTIDAGTEITISDEEGKVLYTYTSEKRFRSVVFSSAEMEFGKNYTVQAGENTETVTTAEKVG